jgi:hypothetical protein
MNTEKIKEHLKNKGYFKNYSLKEIKRIKKSKIKLNNEEYIERVFTTKDGLDNESYVFIILEKYENDFLFSEIIPYKDYTDFINYKQVPKQNFISGYKKFENKITEHDVLTFVIDNCLKHHALLFTDNQALNNQILFYFRNIKNWGIGDIDHYDDISEIILLDNISDIFFGKHELEDWHYVYSAMFDVPINKKCKINMDNIIARFEIGMYETCDTSVRFPVFLTKNNELILCKNNPD